jgi:hypothetical protein
VHYNPDGTVKDDIQCKGDYCDWKPDADPWQSCGILVTKGSGNDERIVASKVPKWALKQARALNADDPVWINHARCDFKRRKVKFSFP